MSMHRVSSRQRLVSWDAFDASCTFTAMPSPSDIAVNDSEPIMCRDDGTFYSCGRSASTSSFHAHAYDDNDDDSVVVVLKRKRHSYATKNEMMHHHGTTILTPTALLNNENRSKNSCRKPLLYDIPPYVIPDIEDEKMSPVDLDDDDDMELIHLPIELQLNVFQFLDVSDLRTMTHVCRMDRHLLKNNSEALEAIWKPMCVQYWPWLQSLDSYTINSTLPDDCTMEASVNSHTESIRNVATATSCIKDTTTTCTNNYPLLLSMATCTMPVQIDTSLFAPPDNNLQVSLRWSRSLRSQHRPRVTPSSIRSSHTRSPKLVLVDTTTTNGGSNGCIADSKRTTSASSSSAVTAKAVQFVGTVGLGDRCIRADAPFPRPTRAGQQNMYSRNMITPRSSFGGGSGGGLLQRWRSGSATTPILPKMMMLCPLRRHRNQDQQVMNSTMYRPFCAPFVARNDHVTDIGMNSHATATMIHMKPRFVAYFEVSILPLSSDIDPPNGSQGRQSIAQDHRVPPVWTNDGAQQAAYGNNNSNMPPDCVAVGLATDTFSLHTRMPGWDHHSYGYHGDDGGLFHGAGSMIKEYGRRFGVGDTIGCGIDYVRQSIFYTLNGQFLGYAFDLSKDHVDIDLYPVIGMDTQYPVWCNFGTCKDQPFVYNIEQMMAQHEPIIRQQLWYQFV
jgi:SPRY domain